MQSLTRLQNKWRLENMKQQPLASDSELRLFQSCNTIFIPVDFVQYFKELNGTGEEYDGSFFQFYALERLNRVSDEYQGWNGIPDYKDIVNSLPECEEYFVFANYQCHLFSYAVKFCPYPTTCSILVICGGTYKKIANSFSEFVDLYLNDSVKLHL